MLSGGRTSSANTGEKLKAAEPVAEAASPEPPTAKAPAISIHDAAEKGDIEAVKQYLAAGTDVKAMDKRGRTPCILRPKEVKRNSSNYSLPTVRM